MSDRKRRAKPLAEMTDEEYRAYLIRPARKRPEPKTLLAWFKRDADGAL